MALDTILYDATHEHEHRCWACHLEELTEGLPEQQAHEGHLAVRFGDMRPAIIRVFLYGVEVTSTFEVLAGSPGIILRYPRPVHVCPCGAQEPCVQRLKGLVEVQVEQAA